MQFTNKKDIHDCIISVPAFLWFAIFYINYTAIDKIDAFIPLFSVSFYIYSIATIFCVYSSNFIIRIRSILDTYELLRERTQWYY